MELKELFDDDDAVSPVIGVILMVAITVILAAVIASFVLSAGNQLTSQTQPQASFIFQYEDGASGGDFSGQLASSVDGVLTITHDGGDSIDENRLSVSDDDGNSIDSLEPAGFGDGSQLSAGDSFDAEIDDDDTIRVIYTAESGDSSTTLGTFEAPQA